MLNRIPRVPLILLPLLAFGCAQVECPGDDSCEMSGTETASPAFDLEMATFVVTSSQDGDSELFLIEGRADAEWTRLTWSVGLDHNAVWIPGRRSIVFHSARNGAGDPSELDLYLLDVAAEFADDETLQGRDQDAIRLTDAPGPDYLAAVDPTGNTVTFVSRRAEDGEVSATGGHIYDVGLDAAAAGNATARRRTSISIDASLPPRWTPDGREILFVRRTAEGTELRAMPATGQGERLILADANFNYTPAQSPDGQWLAYTAENSEGSQVILIRPDGSDRRVLHETGSHYVAGWTPDSRQVLLEGWDPAAERVDAMVMPMDGSSAPERLFTGSNRPSSGVAMRVR